MSNSSTVTPTTPMQLSPSLTAAFVSSYRKRQRMSHQQSNTPSGAPKTPPETTTPDTSTSGNTFFGPSFNLGEAIASATCEVDCIKVMPNSPRTPAGYCGY